MPPKSKKSTKPDIPFFSLYRLTTEVDITQTQQNHPIFRLLQRSFREAACFNDEAREFIQDEFAASVKMTPKKKREQLNLVVREIDDLVAPVPLDFDQSIELFSSPAVSVPNKTATNTPMTPRNVPQFQKHTPAVPVASIAPKSPSRIVKPISVKQKPQRNMVPKAAFVHKKNPLEIDQKAKEDLQKAEERRLQQYAEKTERIRAEREDRDARARERRQQLEEEKKLAASKGYQYRNNEYAPRNIFSPRKPKNPTKIDVVTPRQLQVPLKKGNHTNSGSESATSENTVVTSPKLKRKTNPKAVVIPDTLQPLDEQSASIIVIENDANEIEPEDEQLNYEEVSPQEAFEISNACRGGSSFFASFEQHEAAIQNKDNEDIVPETVIMELPKPPKEVPKLEPLCVTNENTNNTQKVWIPSSEHNYNLDDLDSNDETDDESKPRKSVPKWANPKPLKKAVLELEKHLTIDERALLLGPIVEPEIKFLFGRKHNARPRRSSKDWNSPFSNPTRGISRFPH